MTVASSQRVMARSNVMGWFKNRSLGAKLTLSFSLVLLATLLPALFSLRALYEIHDVALAIQTEGFPKAQRLARINALVSEYRTDELQHLLSREQKEMLGYERELKTVLDRFASAEASYQELSTPRERALYDGFRASWQAYLADEDEVLRASRTNDTDKIYAAFTRTRETFAPLSPKLRALIDLNVQSSTKAIEGAESSFAQTKRWLTLGAITAFAFGMVLTLYLSNSVALPLRSLAEVVDELEREGNLSKVDFAKAGLPWKEASARSADEVMHLSGSLRRLVDALSELANHATAIASGDYRTRSFRNPALTAYLGYDHSSDLVGPSINEIVDAEDRQVFDMLLEHAASGSDDAPMVEVRLVRHNGSIVTAEVAAMPTVFDGEQSILLILRDVTERKEMQAQLLKLARTDHLTGLLIRSAGEEALAREVSHAVRYASGLAFVLFDLDHFKQINDRTPRR